MLETYGTDLVIVKETIEEVLDANNSNTSETTAQLTTILDAGCALSLGHVIGEGKKILFMEGVI